MLKNRLFATVFVGIALPCGSALAQGTTLLTYTGGDFYSFLNSESVPGNYSTAMKVTATIELSSALGANFDGMVTPLRAVFSDGRQTIVNAVAQCSPFIGSVCGSFYFKTDQSGQLQRWYVVAHVSNPVDPDRPYRDIASRNDGYVARDSGNIFTLDAAELDYGAGDLGTWASEEGPAPDLVEDRCGAGVGPWIAHAVVDPMSPQALSVGLSFWPFQKLCAEPLAVLRLN